MRKLLSIVLFIALSALPYTSMTAQDNKKVEAALDEQPTIALTVSADTIRVQNAMPGSVMEIYNILGVKINSFVIDETDKTITLSLPKGYYIFKIGNIVRKMVVK